MPTLNEHYTYDHLLRFGQVLLSSLLITFAFMLFPLFKGDPFDPWLFIDGTLLTTIVIYGIFYRHIFNAGVHLFRNELQIKRLVLDDQIYDFSELRRIRFVQLPAHSFIFGAGSRLRMTLVGQESTLDIEVSDLHRPEAFIEAVELLAQQNAVSVSWQNEKGEFVTPDSDRQQISL